MSLGAATAGAKSGEKPGTPTFFDVLQFAGDDSYPTGGTTDFEAYARSALGRDVDVIAVLAQDCGAFTPVYDPANDTLKVLTAAGAEVTNGTNLSGTTMNVLVVSK